MRSAAVAVAARYANAIAFCSISLDAGIPGSSPRSLRMAWSSGVVVPGGRAFCEGTSSSLGAVAQCVRNGTTANTNQLGKHRRRVTGGWTRIALCLPLTGADHTDCDKPRQNGRFGDTGIAVAARDVGREPVDYVCYTLKYRVAYRLAQDQQQDPPANRPSDRESAALAR